MSCRRYIDRIEKERRSEVEALLGPNAANRFFDCRRSLTYRWYRETQRQSLVRVHACGYPFCRMCGWERKQDLGRRAEIGTKRLQEAQPSLCWLDLLFTVRNCELDDLRRTAEAMNQGFRCITESADWPGVAAIRGLEVKRAEDGLAHPHLHCVVAVKPGFFNGQNYWSEERWAKLWGKAVCIESGPVYIGVKRFPPGGEGAYQAAERISYSQKPQQGEDILWEMRVWKEMKKIKRVQTYGAIKLPPRRVKKDPAIKEWIKVQASKEDTVRFRWEAGWFVMV